MGVGHMDTQSHFIFKHCSTRILSRIVGLLSALGATGLLTASPAVADDVNPINVVMDRSHNSTYQAGGQFQITVRFQASDSAAMTAVGLRETLPEGWSFVGMQGVTGDLPAVAPQPGTQGLLEFAWINIPQLPYVFTYTMEVPQDDSGGNYTIHGQLEYRLNGPAQFAAPVLTTVNGGVDKTPPVISLSGGTRINLSQGQGWSEPGYSARDNVDGDLTSQVQVSGDVNPSVTSTYVLTYTVRDKAGNEGRAQRTVVVRGSGSTAGGGTSNPRGGGGVGNGGGTGTPGGLGGLNNGMAAGVDDGEPVPGTKAATPATQAGAPAVPQKSANLATPAPATPATGGSLTMRPGVPASKDPATGLPVSAVAGAAPAGANPAAPVSAHSSPPDTAKAEQGEVPSEKKQEADKLSDAWPELGKTQPVDVAKVDGGIREDGAPGAPVIRGPKTPAANLIVIAAVAAVCLAGIGGGAFAARNVYGGRKRRAAPPKQT